jgi:hypothetical protein
VVGHHSASLLRRFNLQMETLCQRILLCGFRLSFFNLVYHYLSTRMEEEVNTHRSSYGWKAVTRWSAARCPSVIGNDTCCHGLSAMQLWVPCFTPWPRWTTVTLAVPRRYPPQRRERQGSDFGGDNPLAKSLEKSGIQPVE